MLVLLEKLSTKGLQMIAPTPQQKFRMFRAEAPRRGFISSISILTDGNVSPTPSPLTKKPNMHRYTSPEFISSTPTAIEMQPRTIAARYLCFLPNQSVRNVPKMEPKN